MKPLFAIDLTNDMNNDKMNVEPFLACHLVVNEKTGASELVQVGKFAAKKKEPETVAQTRELTRREQRWQRHDEKIMKREEKKQLREEKKRLYDEQFYDEKTKKRIALMRALESAYSDMGVPKDADDADIFSFSYVVKNGEIIPVTNYVNLPMKIYVKDRNLYISDLTRAYAFSLESIKSIVKVKKKIVFPSWHRDMPYNDSLYTPFRIQYRKFRRLYVSKYYYVLNLEEGKEKYQIMFAPYDIAAFERLAEVNCINR